jgi:hypothetical protein
VHKPYWEKHWKPSISDYKEFETELHSKFEPVAAFDKISENTYIPVYLSHNDYIEIQNYQARSRNWTRWIPTQETDICLQITSMQKYLKQLRASWELLMQKAEVLHPNSEGQPNFQYEFKNYISQVNGNQVDSTPHDEDPTLEPETCPNAGIK